jgi:hypothetical protein
LFVLELHFRYVVSQPLFVGFCFAEFVFIFHLLIEKLLAKLPSQARVMMGMFARRSSGKSFRNGKIVSMFWGGIGAENNCLKQFALLYLSL